MGAVINFPFLILAEASCTFIERGFALLQKKSSLTLIRFGVQKRRCSQRSSAVFCAQKKLKYILINVHENT